MIFNRNESDFNWTLFCYSAKYLFNRSLLLLYKNFFKKQSCFNFGAFYGGTPRFFCAFTSCFHHNHMLPKDRFFYLKMFTWAKKLWNCMFVKIFQVSAIEEMGLFCINFIGWWISFCYTSFAVQINIACLLKIIIASELRAEGLVYLPTLVLQLVANIIFFCSIPCAMLITMPENWLVIHWWENLGS